MPKNLKIGAIFFIIISAIGFFDASYLTFKHYEGKIPPCTINGCETVLTSPQSEIANIPISLFGALYYLTILILTIVYLYNKNLFVFQLASYLTIIGFAISVYLVSLQLFVIKQICQYCMLSAGTSTFLFIIGMYNLIQTRHKSSITE